MRKFSPLNIDLNLNDLLKKLAGEIFILLQEADGDFAIGWGVNDEMNITTGSELDEFQTFVDKHKGVYIFGYLSYDLKNLFEERLRSSNKAHHNFSLAHFFVPDHLLISEAGKTTYFGEKDPLEMEKYLGYPDQLEGAVKQGRSLESETDKETYLKNVSALKQEIQNGNIYEVNYCVNWIAQNCQSVSGAQLYLDLFKESEAPFSSFYNHPNHQIISASPERFIRKQENRLYSQPIKGTAKRGQTREEDQAIAKALQEDPKERSENIMITDLVRNDLSKVAKKNSVRVDALCQLKSFKTVHQLVSTVSCELKEEAKLVDILAAAFPMGSMTGAPKISAMEHSEKFETFRRQVYSGSVGYIEPNGNFDFNVVIRSFLRNRKSGTITAAVGGAITIDSDPNKEYEECLLKLKALEKVLS